MKHWASDSACSLPEVTRQARILKLPLVRTVVAAGDGALQLKPVVRAEHP